MKKEHTNKLDRYFQGVKAGTLGRQNERNFCHNSNVKKKSLALVKFNSSLNLKKTGSTRSIENKRGRLMNILKNISRVGVKNMRKF